MQQTHESTRPSHPVPVRVRIDHRSESNFYEGFDTEDLGVFVASYAWHRTGTVVEVTVELPGAYEVHAPGIVRWLNVSDDEEAVPGMGIELLDLAESSIDLISAFTATRPPRFHA